MVEIGLVLAPVFWYSLGKDEMSEDQLTTCKRCGRPAPHFGRMRHQFVDADFQTICVGCARELVPDQVARAEEMDRQWGAGDTPKD
jgi:hypothetical protein